jgi:hypothetical protein
VTRGSRDGTQPASGRTSVKEVVTLLGKSKMRGKRFCIRCLEARETEDIHLVKLTPMVLEIGHYDLPNRVCRDEACDSHVGESGERRKK